MAFIHYNSSSLCEHFLTSVIYLVKTCRSNWHIFPMHNLFQNTSKYFEFLLVSSGEVDDFLFHLMSWA